MATSVNISFKVSGFVSDSKGNRLPSLLVRAFDRDLRTEEPLGECLTDEQGKYSIQYRPEQFSNAEKKTADLSMKVFSRDGKALLYAATMDDVMFNAPADAAINITVISQVVPVLDEFDSIIGNITPLLQQIPINSLLENNIQRDITFLKKETGIDGQKLEYLVLAFRLSSISKIDPAFFYALLRENTLLKVDITRALNSRSQIDINADPLPLLYDIALTDPNIIKLDIQQAINDFIIPAKVLNELELIFRLLSQFKERATEYRDKEQPQKVMNLITNFILTDKITEVQKLFQQNKNDYNKFFDSIFTDVFFDPTHGNIRGDVLLSLSKVLGYDEHIIKQVTELQKITKPGDIKKLASLSHKDWKALLTKSSSKINVAGQPIDEKLIDFHANSLVHKMEKQFPSAAFGAQLNREKKPRLAHHEAIKNLLNNNEDFDLKETNIDLFIKSKNLHKEFSEDAKRELKSVQRIFKLVPHYEKTHALLNHNIHSAQSIVGIGKSRFVNEIAPKAGISKKEAADIFNKAESVHTASILIVGELQDTIRANDIAALNMPLLPEKLEAVSKDFPNLKILFQLTDLCACDHCRSVYSPAAYMVEALQFLSNRSVIDTTASPPVTAHLAKDLLFERRPDLGDIDLGCENAETPLPYIDLVCELLESTVAPDTGFSYNGVLSDGADPNKGIISNTLLAACLAANIPMTANAEIYETELSVPPPVILPPVIKYLRDENAVCKLINTGVNTWTVLRLRQTLSTAEELAACPEYVNENAYNTLAASKFAFQLPFDLNHTEAYSYFSRFGIGRSDLMYDFQVLGSPADFSIAAERLDLTDDERILIVTPDPGNQQTYWNTTPNPAGDVLKVVDTFLTKTGMSYADLNVLLDLSFINPGNVMFIKHLDLSCDTEQKIIANLDDNALDRIHRFLRLQKKTGWKSETLNEFITQPALGNGNLDNNCLIVLESLYKLYKGTGVKLDELVGFYGQFPHEQISGSTLTPLYQSIFLNKAKNGFIDYDLLPEKIDGSKKLADVKTTLCVCLQISELDFDKITATFANTDLTFANLSLLYATSRLCRKLKLKIDDYIILKELTGLDVFSSPAVTLEFIQHNVDSKNSPLKLADVRFMLNHSADDLSNREISDDKILTILQGIQKSYQNAFNTDRSPFDDNLRADELKEPLTNLLAKLPQISTVPDDARNMSPADVANFIRMVDRIWVTPPDPTASTYIDLKLGSFFDTTGIKTAQNALATKIPLTPDYDFEPERKALIKAFLTPLSDFFYKQDKASALVTALGTAFKTDEDEVAIVLQDAILKQPAPGTASINDLLSTDSFIDTVNIPPVPPIITEIAFPGQYRCIRLLHKMFPLIAAFKLENTDIDWLIRNDKPLGWFEFDSIPYETGQTAIDYTLWEDFCQIVNLMKNLTPVENPADVENPLSFTSLIELLLPGALTTTGEWLDAFCLLTGYDITQITDLDTYFGFSVPDLSAYTEIDTWTHIDRCISELRILGSTVAQVQEFIKPKLTAIDASNLRMALKARYDEDLWLDTLKEIMDNIRPQKRDALVAYLLAVNPDMKDENDLYDYFLIDTQMESCMPSSRIVQAHGTIQLFAQRCIMGLEPKAAADITNDKSWDQWQWMKNYRVWEANRKVFLYPENWIAPELLDNKSFLFSDLENQLLQNELDESAAEDALTRYLEKLDDIAFLEIVATYYQTDIFTMHVFARTKGGDPPIYYYRTFEKERTWSPWEKVDLDITSNSLLAFVRNDRLHLAWPIFTNITNPEQQVSVPGVSTSPSAPQSMQKAEKKLKVQLALSEYANYQWKPKKVSQDGILTPPDIDPNNPVYSTEDIPQDKFKFIYNQFGDQIIVLNTIQEWQDVYNGGEFPVHQLVDVEKLAGAFDLTGCKGYPELANPKPFNFDFIPKFRDTDLIDQRFQELNQDSSDDLSIINAIFFKSFVTYLRQTPGTFRLTYPLQFTVIDFLALLYELLIIKANGAAGISNERRLKIPMGTLLPYFFEDSFHAYVLIPGFYSEKLVDNLNLIEIKRTYSDVLQLVEDISALIQKYLLIYNNDPAHDIVKLFHELIADTEYQRILAEIKLYLTLRYGEQFKNMYHPLVCLLRKTLYKDGVPALMKRETQLFQSPFNFVANYQPNTAVIPIPYPVEDLDFSSDGSYSSYNWEMFFHIPLMIANRLSSDQKFEEALTWYHYMFNPTGALEGTVPEKYWVTKPFFLTHIPDYINQRIDNLLYNIADPTNPLRNDLEFAVSEWRENPFMPHVVARYRPVAYQKTLLMNYINNLIQWGDYLFRQDTMESVNQATQMYILADKLLGPKPRIIPPVVKPPYETYNQIEAKIDAFGNALIEFENILPDITVLPHKGAELPPGPITLSSLYFCIPQNDNMLAYWDTIADRLFKIRHCQDIDGVERTLALFAPPIDPGMLVRAAAAGLDISSILSGLNAPLPFYRFNILSQKATELTQEVRTLGNSLLQALEKKDAENLSLLRSQLEIKLLKAVRDLKVLQITEAKEQIDILGKTRKVTEERHTYYTNIQKIIPNEQLNLDKLAEAHDFQTQAQIVQATGTILSIIPDFTIGAHGIGGSPAVHATLGGSNLSRMTSAAATVLNFFSGMASYEASRASTLGSFDRRFDDWKLQERLSQKELDQIDKQILAAQIRQQISETDLNNQDVQIDNAQQVDAFLHKKYTNNDLYQWMIGQISSVYFQAYKLANDFAKKAERSYQHELGSTDTFIQYGYWDNLKKGLLSADHLYHDIKRMETSYLDKNKREYEITKHVSLVLLDPLAIVRLKATGTCDFEIPEALYDMDFPGQYFRRIKTVSITLPCIAGPYTSVSAKLSLVSNKYRKNTNPGADYNEDPGNDDRFTYNVGSIQSIATSSGQNDNGMFELNFRDERYLPFEGTGAISTWRLELPTGLKQFDYNTISDVLLHIKYTAREGGSTLKGLAATALADNLNQIRQQISETGLHIAFNMKQDLPDEWYMLKNSGSVNLQIGKSRLPYFVQSFDANIGHVTFIARVKNNPASFTIKIDGTDVILNRKDDWQLCLANVNTIILDTQFSLSVIQAQLANLDDLVMIVKYDIS